MRRKLYNFTMQTFAQFMEEALYGSNGYYTTGRARSGKTGDYFTASDVGAVFGELLAAYFAEWRGRLNVPVFHLVECGPGEGALAESLRAVLPSKTYPYQAIERSPARRERLQAKGLTAVADLERPVTGCLFGNELIDAFPVHRVRQTPQGLEEAYVENSRLEWGQPSTPELARYLERLNITLPDDYETEINLGMRAWLEDAARAIERGPVVLLDYGRPAHEYYHPDRTRGTLRAFSNHQVSDDWLAHPGEQDLTADVDFTSLALDARAAGLEPLAFLDFSAFLLLAAEMRHKATKWEPQNPRALQMLVHPDALGTAFQVMILGKGLRHSEWEFPHNRIKRLGLEEYDAQSRR